MPQLFMFQGTKYVAVDSHAVPSAGVLGVKNGQPSKPSALVGKGALCGAFGTLRQSSATTTEGIWPCAAPALFMPYAAQGRIGTGPTTFCCTLGVAGAAHKALRLLHCCTVASAWAAVQLWTRRANPGDWHPPVI